MSQNQPIPAMRWRSSGFPHGFCSRQGGIGAEADNKTD